MRRWRRFAVQVWLGLMLAAATSAASAADVVGSVVAARGAVFSDAGAGQQALTVNARVHRGETIVTGAGKVKIALADGSIISIGENSRVRLPDAGTAAGANIRVNLVAGVVRALVVKTGSAGGFEIETETAIAAVRGTEWVVDATPENTGVAVLRGVVAVSSRGDRRATVVLRTPGQGTDVRRGATPTPPTPWGIKRLADVLARATVD